MIDKFVSLWYQCEDDIRENLKQIDKPWHNITYKVLLQCILRQFNKAQLDRMARPFQDDNIKVIDYGDYQGTLILVFAEDDYQPLASQTYYIPVEYGSCAGCDVLQAILANSADWDELNTRQLNDLMTLCLHMIERIRCFDEK